MRFRLACLVAACLFLASPSQAAFSITSLGADGSQTGATATLATVASCAAGSTIVVGVSDRNTSIGSQAVADSAGNTYTRISFTIGNNVIAAFYYAYNITSLVSGANIQLTKASSDQGSLSAVCITGMASGDPLDTAVTNFAGSAAIGQPTVTSGIPSVSGEMFIGLAATPGGLGAGTEPSGFSAPPDTYETQAAGAGRRVFGGNMVEVGTSAHVYNPTFATVPNAWAAGIIGIKPAGAAPPPSTLHGFGLLGVGG